MEKRRNCSLGAISPLFHNIFYLLLDFHVKAGTRFSLRNKRLFEISEFEITRVNCSLSYSGPVIWNTIPSDIKNSSTLYILLGTLSNGLQTNNSFHEFTDLHCNYHFRIISPPHFIIVNIIFMYRMQLLCYIICHDVVLLLFFFFFFFFFFPDCHFNVFTYIVHGDAF